MYFYLFKSCLLPCKSIGLQVGNGILRRFEICTSLFQTSEINGSAVEPACCLSLINSVLSDAE